MQAQISLQDLFSNLRPILTNSAPFKQKWQDSSFYYDAVQQVPILVVGAGGLGCQIVKNLALSGIRNIHLVDMDTIDFTNLNRQFLFRKKDVGGFKADAVASFVQKRCPGVKITTQKIKVQQLPYSYYTQFPIIVGGLDNVQARKYLNHVVFKLNENSQETACYYIDGATQGFQGQALLVQPFKTSCYECSLLDGLTNKPKVNYCTLANTPRTPQHCIQYILQVLWDEQRKGQVRDNDNLDHMNWIYQKSLQRAKKFKIQGVTQMLTLGVAKNVIPAIASTNALIAAICTNQVFKILSGCNPKLNNYILYKGGTSTSSETYAYQKKQTCPACLMRVNRLEKVVLNITYQTTFSQIFQQVRKHHQQVKNPFVNYRGNILINPGDEQRFHQKVNATFEKFISQGLIKSSNIILVSMSDKSLKSQLQVQLHLSNAIQQQ